MKGNKKLLARMRRTLHRITSPKD